MSEKSRDSHKRYALYIGRWQPFHNGHKHIIDQALSQGKKVCIAIRDTELSEKNPYTVEHRAEMIKRVYGDKVKIIAIPDIESINIGRKAGYSINQIDVPSAIGNISATDIRKGNQHSIPKQVSEYLRELKTTIWFTGLPCSGKTTLARRLKEELIKRGYSTIHLDADEVRKGINLDLGFSPADRKENLRRVAHIAKLFNNAGQWVVSSFITPTEETRKMVRNIIGTMRLVYLKCSLEECERRDTKGMYKKARAGEIEDFTGISAPFEEAEDAITIDTEKNNVEACVKEILEKLRFL